MLISYAQNHHLKAYADANWETTAQFENEALDACQAKYYVRKSCIILAGTCIRKNSTLACGSNPNEIHYFDY